MPKYLCIIFYSNFSFLINAHTNTYLTDVNVQRWNHRDQLYRRHPNMWISIEIHQHDRNHYTHNQFQIRQQPNAVKMFACYLIAIAVAETFQVNWTCHDFKLDQAFLLLWLVLCLVRIILLHAFIITQINWSVYAFFFLYFLAKWNIILFQG